MTCHILIHDFEMTIHIYMKSATMNEECFNNADVEIIYILLQLISKHLNTEILATINHFVMQRKIRMK